MYHTTPTNIIGFARPADSMGRRRRVFWMMIIVTICIMIGSAITNQIIRKSTNRSLAGLEKIIPDIASSQALQQIALAGMQAYRDQKPLPQNMVLKLYNMRYEEQCLTHASNPGCQLYDHRDELLNYLGYSGSKTYLILLQNSAEVRPNGGFYGSFIRLTLSGGMIDQMSIHDSYEVPFTNSGVMINLPDRTINYLGDNTATFIAGNKFGFTERDGLVISSIYNKTYNTEIDGVIFVSTNTLLKLIPSIQSTLRERQFINASVDLIRGHSGSRKKELYMTQLQQYLNQNKIGLITQAYSNIDDLFAPGMIQTYLPQSSTGLRQKLLGFGWITNVADHHIYARDINQSFNKISTFVDKYIALVDRSGQVIQHSSTNIIDLTTLNNGQYQLLINYDINVPQYYIRTIRDLEQQYDIQLTLRESHILGIDPVYEYRSVVFGGKGIQFNSITGDVDNTAIFDAGLGGAVAYQIPPSTGTVSLTIDFIKSDPNP